VLQVAAEEARIGLLIGSDAAVTQHKPFTVGQYNIWIRWRRAGWIGDAELSDWYPFNLSSHVSSNWSPRRYRGGLGLWFNIWRTSPFCRGGGSGSRENVSTEERKRSDGADCRHCRPAKASSGIGKMH